MRKTITIIFVFLLLNVISISAEKQQVRVIDKITVEQLTTGTNQHSSPRIYEDYIVWEESDSENRKIIYKNLLSGELKEIDSIGISVPGGFRLLNIFENYITYFESYNLWVYDLNKNQKFIVHEIGQGPVVHNIVYSNKQLVYDCSEGVCIYDLSDGNEGRVYIPELNNLQLNIRTFLYSYPYLYFENGLYNLETKKFFEIYFGQSLLKIIDNKLLYEPLISGTSKNQLNLYDPIEDKQEIYLQLANYAICCEWRYAKEYNKIFVSRGKCLSGEDSDESELNVYDGNQNKLYSIKSGACADYDLFDDKILFIMRNENTGSLKHPVDTQIYLARLHFKFIDVKVNETKLPLTKKIETEEIAIVEKSVGEPMIYKNEIQGCTKDSQCEAGLCNIETGYCVECYNSKCDCQEGFKPCLDNTKCVKTKTKDAGDYYDCEFECKSGLGKNGQCIDPITFKLSTTKQNIKVAESTNIIISFASALDNVVDVDLTITLGNGVIIASSDACQSGSPNLCKSFHKIGAKETKQITLDVECVDSIDKVPINGKVTYTAKDQTATIEDQVSINCYKPTIIERTNFFESIISFFRRLFS